MCIYRCGAFIVLHLTTAFTNGAVIKTASGRELVPVHGWRYNKTVVERNRYILDNQLYTDVVFEVGPLDGDRMLVRAHRLILASRSAVFDSLLFGAEQAVTVGPTHGPSRAGSRAGGQQTTSPNRTIAVSDVQPQVFKDMLMYVNVIYTVKQIVLSVFQKQKSRGGLSIIGWQAGAVAMPRHASHLLILHYLISGSEKQCGQSAEMFVSSSSSSSF